MKGLVLWLYELCLEIVEYVADALLTIFGRDIAYFESSVPVTSEIVTIVLAVGWAFLIGNFAFQAMKSMASGIGFEGEDPKILFCRTFVFAFLLLASRQICDIGLGITGSALTLLQMPNSVSIPPMELELFALPGSWLLIVIIGFVLMIQIVKFFFEIGERYVVLVILTILSPLAFSMGGSKNTEDIFKGWARMYGSMCLMMLLNVVFLKLLLSAMSNVPEPALMIPWLIMVVAIARVARKADDIVARIGLNPARTGDPLGRGAGGLVSMMVVRSLMGTVSKTVSANRSSTQSSGGRRQGGAAGGSKPGSPGGGPRPSRGGDSARRGGTGAPAQAAPAPGRAGDTQAAVPVPRQPGNAGEKEAAPSRPPVGTEHNETARKEAQNRPESGWREEKEAGRGRDARPPLSADSKRPDGIHTNTGKQTTEGPAGTARKDRPVLSADSKTPENRGIPGSKSPVSAGAANPAGRNRPKKPVNIDIFHDDDPPSGKPRSAGRPSSISPPPAGNEAGIPGRAQTPHTRADNTPERPGSAAPPSGVSSSRGGRIGAGAAAPGSPHRPPSAGRPASVQTPNAGTARSAVTETGASGIYNRQESAVAQSVSHNTVYNTTRGVSHTAANEPAPQARSATGRSAPEQAPLRGHP